MANWKQAVLEKRPGYIRADVDGLVSIFDDSAKGHERLADELGLDTRPELIEPEGVRHTFPGDIEAVVSSVKVTRSVSWHPYGSSFVAEKHVEVEVDGVLIIPFGRGLEDLKLAEPKMIVHAEDGSVAPDIRTITFIGCSERGVVATCDWRLA